MTQVCHKLISVNGPSFSGKTYFIHKLLERLYDIDHKLRISINSFECVYDKKLSYKQMCNNFISNIENKLKVNDITIAESTIIKFEDSLKIALFPNEDYHKEMYHDYLSLFGLYDSLRRTGTKTIGEIRKDFTRQYCLKEADIIVDSNDYNNALREIVYYVKH